jgi:hypothetical protein
MLVQNTSDGKLVEQEAGVGGGGGAWAAFMCTIPVNHD